MKLSEQTLALLRDVENRIDPETEDEYLAQWDAFLRGRFPGTVFAPKRKKTSAPAMDFPAVGINDAIADYDRMLYSQLLIVSERLRTGTGSLCVRSNYGTGILTSVFGAEIFMMAPELNELPTTRSVSNDSLSRIIDAGVPALTAGFGKQVFEMGEIFKEVFARYPKIERYVQPYHPDFQGPLDLAELLWGCELLYAMADEPETVHTLLRLITDTYIRFMDAWLALFPAGEINSHWGLRHKGAILLRNDSAMNVSPAYYREFAFPYDRELLERYHGGAVHYCGRGDHYLPILTSCESVTGINLSQPQYNDMETVFRCTVDRGIPILGFPADAAEQYAGRDFRHLLSV